MIKIANVQFWVHDQEEALRFYTKTHGEVARGPVALSVRHMADGRRVKDCGFDLHAGEILSIIGPNGAGKTTVFNCITGLVAPQRGEVSLRGERSLLKVKPHKIVSLGLARTFQGVRLFEGLNVADNCLVGLSAHQGRLVSRHGLLGRTSAHDRREALRWLTFVGLAGQAHQGRAQHPVLGVLRGRRRHQHQRRVPRRRLHGPERRLP